MFKSEPTAVSSISPACWPATALTLSLQNQSSSRRCSAQWKIPVC